MYKKEFIAMDKLEGRTGRREEDNFKWVLCALLGRPCPPPPQCQGVRRAPQAPVEWLSEGWSDMCGGLRHPPPSGVDCAPRAPLRSNCSVSSSCYYSNPHYRDLSSRSNTTTTQPVTRLRGETGHFSGAAGENSQSSPGRKS